MKAWLIKEKDEFLSAVAFAPTAGKAKYAALYSGQLDDAEYINLQANRLPEADSYYNGNEEPYCLDWLDQDDRLFLVKECDFRCENFLLENCETCKSKDYCGEYQQWLDDNEEVEY